MANRMLLVIGIVLILLAGVSHAYEKLRNRESTFGTTGKAGDVEFMVGIGLLGGILLMVVLLL
jgi:hypothetical protein